MKTRHTARAVTRVLAIGSLIEQKGHLVLLRSCERLVRAGVDFECHIIGEGPLRGRLEREIAARRLERHVGLRGSLPHDLTMAELEQADIFALPCIDMRGRGEHVDGIPIVLMEAMAVGLPVVSTRLSGIPELIESGIAGVLVAPEDHDAIAAALEQLVASPALRESFGRAARARVIERFDLARNTAALARLMRTAAG